MNRGEPVLDLATIWGQLADQEGAPTGAVVRRILPDLVHDAFVGESRPSGRRFFQVKIYGPTGITADRDPSTRGLKVTLRRQQSDQCELLLEATDTVLVEQFDDVVADAIRLMVEAPSNGLAGRLIDRLMAWKLFFSSSSSLSEAVLAGLFAEIYVLEHAILPKMASAVDAIQAWVGPNRALQDFQMPSCAVEVKSYRGSGAGSLQISSERQLAGALDSRLYIAYVEIVQSQGVSGVSLQALISGLHTKIADSSVAQIEFRTKLLSIGWSSAQQSDAYFVSKLEFYEVRRGFPCITPDDLAPGVSGVSYKVDRSAIQKYKVDLTEVCL